MLSDYTDLAIGIEDVSHFLDDNSRHPPCFRDRMADAKYDRVSLFLLPTPVLKIPLNKCVYEEGAHAVCLQYDVDVRDCRCLVLALHLIR